MKVAEAAAILGVGAEERDETLIRAAYRRAVKLSHPDVGGGYLDASANIARAQKARDTLLALCSECAACRGTGAVAGFVCKRCRGSGR